MPIGLSYARRCQYFKINRNYPLSTQSPPFTLIPVCTIHPGQIVITQQIQWHIGKPHRNRLSNLGDTGNDHEGRVSANAKRKITKAIDYLLFYANDKILPSKSHGKNYHYKVAFVTLTLPSKQIHSDHEIKSICLDSYLTELRKCYQVKNYVWRAERQKNGNIHFHLLIDKFIPYWQIRDRWNRIVNRLGYVNRFQNVHGHNVPNSTDIHSLKYIINARNYLLKYVTKDEKTDKIDGRMWGCSESLSKIRGGQIVIDSKVSREIQKAIEYNPSSCFTSDYYTVCHIDIQTLQNLGCDKLVGAFSDFSAGHFNVPLQTLLTFP